MQIIPLTLSSEIVKEKLQTKSMPERLCHSRESPFEGALLS